MLVCSLRKWCSQIIAGEGISKNFFQNTGFIFGRLVGCVGFFLFFVLLVLNACVWGWLALEHRLLAMQRGLFHPRRCAWPAPGRLAGTETSDTSTLRKSRERLSSCSPQPAPVPHEHTSCTSLRMRGGRSTNINGFLL